MTTELEPRLVCPNCGTELSHYSGLEHIPYFYYCPKCNDWAYNEKMEVLFRLL